MSEPLTKLSYGEISGDGLVELTHAVHLGRPTLAITVSYCNIKEENEVTEVTGSWKISEEELADFCAVLLNLRPIFRSSGGCGKQDEGDYLFVMPKGPDPRYMGNYFFNVFYLERAKDNFENDNLMIEKDTLLEALYDGENNIHKCSVATECLWPSTRSILTAFALRRLSDSWDVPVADCINILKINYQ